jgi:hypothetical protein
MSHVRVLNISQHGMAIELPQQPMRNGMIRIQSERYKLSACGSVRHILQVGGKYVVGLELPADVQLPVLPIPLPVELALEAGKSTQYIDGKQVAVSPASGDDWFSRFAASLDGDSV